MVFLGREISEQKDYSDRVALEIDREVDKIIRNAHKVATEVLTKNRAKLIHLAQTLIARETLDGETLEEVLKAEVQSETEAQVPVAADTSVPEEKPKPQKKRRVRKAPAVGPILTEPSPAPSD